MDAFCTRCGASLGTDSTFCTCCGLGIAPNDPRAPNATPKKTRTQWWVLAIILFFVLGVLVGRLFGPKCTACPGDDSSNGGAGAAAAGHGKPLSPSAGDGPNNGGGGRRGAGPADAEGGQSEIGPVEGSGKMTHHDLNGEDRAGNNDPGKHDLRDGPPNRLPHLSGEEQELYGNVALLASGKTLYGADDRVAVSDPSPGKQSFSALDFSYDKTNLPRYPTDVSVAASSVSYVTSPNTGDRTGAYGTGAGIVTSSSFDDVVSWYQNHVSPGWQGTTLSDFSLLAKNLSENKITQLLLGQTGEVPADKLVPPTARNLKLSLFKPPSVGADTQNSSIMIVQEEGKPVTVYLQSQVK